MGVSGAQAQMERNPGYYHQLLQGERNDSLEEAIRTGENGIPPWVHGAREGGGGAGIIPKLGLYSVFEVMTLTKKQTWLKMHQPISI